MLQFVVCVAGGVVPGGGVVATLQPKLLSSASAKLAEELAVLESALALIGTFFALSFLLQLSSAFFCRLFVACWFLF